MTSKSTNYADNKFDQGLTTIRNRINMLSNSGGLNNSSTMSNKTVRTTVSNNNIANKLGSLQEEC